MNLMDASGRIKKSDQFQFNDEILQNTDQVCCHYVDHCIPFPPTFYRTKSVRNIDVWHNMKSFADGIFFTQVVKNGPIKIMKKRLYNYRIHENQVSKNTNRFEETKFLLELEKNSSKSKIKIKKHIANRLTNALLNDISSNIFNSYKQIKNAHGRLSILYALQRPKLMFKALLRLALNLHLLKDYNAIASRFSNLCKSPVPRISIIIFSRDRPMQLHALLESLYSNLKNPFCAFVIWKTSNKEFFLCYQKVKQAFSLVSFIQEKDFFFDVSNLVQECDKHIMFATDDSLLFKNTEIISFEQSKMIAAFSLRLGDNVSFSHPLNRSLKKPNILKTEKLNIWKWRGADAEFGYPMSLDGHIFNKNFLLGALKDLLFSNPNQLEDELYKKIKSGPPCWMVSFASSHYVSVPINRVQNQFQNRCGEKVQNDPKNLAQKYKMGKKIDLEKTILENPQGTHHEYVLKFKTETIRKCYLK